MTNPVNLFTVPAHGRIIEPGLKVEGSSPRHLPLRLRNGRRIGHMPMSEELAAQVQDGRIFSAGIESNPSCTYLSSWLPDDNQGLVILLVPSCIDTMQVKVVATPRPALNQVMADSRDTFIEEEPEGSSDLLIPVFQDEEVVLRLGSTATELTIRIVNGVPTYCQPRQRKLLVRTAA
jgi:hypothetical protein